LGFSGSALRLRVSKQLEHKMVERKLDRKADLEAFQAVDDKIQSVPDVHGCIEGALKTQLAEDKNEELEIMLRKTSLLIHGI